MKVILESILWALGWRNIFNTELHRNSPEYFFFFLNQPNDTTNWLYHCPPHLPLLHHFPSPPSTVSGLDHCFSLFGFGTSHCVAHLGLAGLFCPLVVSARFKGTRPKILVLWDSFGERDVRSTHLGEIYKCTFEFWVLQRRNLFKSPDFQFYCILGFECVLSVLRNTLRQMQIESYFCRIRVIANLTLVAFFHICGLCWIPSQLTSEMSPSYKITVHCSLPGRLPVHSAPTSLLSFGPSAPHVFSVLGFRWPSAMQRFVLLLAFNLLVTIIWFVSWFDFWGTILPLSL